MSSIVEKLITTKRINEGRVGVFYMIGDNILTNSRDIRDHKAESYGGYTTYSDHMNLWTAIEHQLPKLKAKGIDIHDFPRGRVVYDQEAHKYIVYLDPFINEPRYINLIRKYYNLPAGSYIINTTDEHYNSVEDPDDYALNKDYVYDGILETYLRENKLPIY